MKKFIILYFLLGLQVIWAQQPTQPFYFDLSYERVEKGSRAEYYATHTPIANSQLSDIVLYRIDTNTMHIKGQAVWDGKKIDFQSNVYTYLTDGTVLNTKYYNKKKKAFTHEVSYNPATKDSLVILDKPSNHYQGEVYDSYNGKLFYTQIHEGVPTKEIVYNLNNQKNRLEVNYNKDYETIDEAYYDEKGKKKYAITYKDNEPYEGTSVILSYPLFGMGILSEFTKGKETTQTTYYSTGEVKQKTTVSNNISTTKTYSRKGNLLGTFTEQYTEGQSTTKKSGTKYVFGHIFVDFDSLLEEQYYTKDLLQKKVDYKYAKDTHYASIITTYKNGLPILTEYFDANKKKLDQTTYVENETTVKDGLQINSTVYDIYRKDGDIIKEIFKYGTQEIFSIDTPTAITFYTREGKEMGKATKYESYWGQYAFDTGNVYELIYDIPLLTSKYQDKKLIYKVEYAFDTVIPTILVEQFYTQEVLTEQKTYYKDGQLKEHLVVTIDERTSKPIDQYSIYYDFTGKELGRYNHTQKTGTKY
ncbi:MAG: hypothetical protein LBI72_10075 [Flavobacteriaceae bacterium]|nr:hypothetical protein [Flavobacteriaceae bacterium]